MRIDVKAVLFDSDGVLIDSHDQVVAAWRQLSDEFDLDFGDLLGRLFGVRSEDTLARYLSDGALAAAVVRLENIEVELATTCEPLPGAVELIDTLPPGTWTIVTSGSTRLATARWRGAGIPVPSVVITADDVTAGKPDPQPYRRAAELLGFDAARTVVFEDSSAGGEAGRSAGATVVAVGDHPWSTVPVARVENLAQVTASPNGSGITLTLDC